VSGHPGPWLFAYGTLRQPEVQQVLFGRHIDEMEDALAGFRIDTIEIAEPDIVNLSGKAIHLILRRAADAADPIPGAALALSAAELAIADDYEGERYRRITATLASGRRAFVYVASDDRDEP
jgi:hypothetical protein